MASLDAETCREITVIKSALVGDFTHIMKMHGENNIKSFAKVYNHYCGCPHVI
jgi:hypothetical protein